MNTELLEKSPTQASVEDLMRSQLFREAIVVLGDSVEFHATDERLWLDLASCYKKIQRCDLAQRSLEKGLNHNPASKDLSFALIRLCLEQGSEVEALALMKSCENDLVQDLPLFADYCELLWESDQVDELQAVLSRWSEDIKSEPFSVFYQTRILLLQQRAEEAAVILGNFFESHPITSEFKALFEEVFRHLFSYKFPWIHVYEPTLIHRLSDIAEDLVQADEPSPDNTLLTIQLALVDRQYEKAIQAIDSARQLIAYSESESFKSSVDYYADLLTTMISEVEPENKNVSIIINGHSIDIDSVMARFLYCWKSDAEEGMFSAVEKLIAFSNVDDSPILWCLRFFVEQGQPDQALKVAERWKKTCPHATQAAMQTVDLLAASGRNSETVAGIQEILTHEEYISADMRTHLIKIAIKLKNLSLIEQLITGQVEFGQLSLTECIDYYRLLMANKKYKKSIEVIQNQTGKKNIAENILLQNLLSDAYSYAEQYEEGLQVLQAFIDTIEAHDDSSTAQVQIDREGDKIPTDLLFHTTPASLYLRLALLYRATGDHHKHASSIEKAYALTPTHPICQYAWLVLQNVESTGEPNPGFDLDQINSIEEAIGRYETTIDIFIELITAEFIQRGLPGSAFDAPAIKDAKTAKLTYALLSPSEKFSALSYPNVEEFSARMAEENGLGDTWVDEYGENSIFLQFIKDDLWFKRVKELSQFLPIRLNMAESYLEQYPTSEAARAVYADAVVCTYLWDTFLGELDIPVSHTRHSTQTYVKDLTRCLQPRLLTQDFHFLWKWYQAIESNQVILFDKIGLDGISDELFAYYLVAIRKTKTKIPLPYLIDRAGSPNLFLHVQLAFSLWTIGEYEQALEIVRGLPDDLPDDPILHCVIARIYEANQLMGKAISHLDAALRQYGHVTIWHEWMAGWAYDYEDPSKAAQHLEILHNQNPGDGGITVLLIHCYLKDKRLNKAKKLLDHWIKMVAVGDDKEENDTAALKVLYFALKEDLDKGLLYLNGSPCQSPLIRDAYLAVANLALKQQKSELALRCVQIAYGYQPHHALTLITLASVLLSLHHIDDAKKILGQVDMSNNPAVCYEKLLLLEAIVDEKSYSEQLLIAYELFPHHPGIVFRVAQFQAKTGSERKASELLGTLFAYIEPTDEQLVFAGELHLKLGNLDKAIAYMSDVISRQPNDIKAYLTLASAYVQQRQYGAAMEVFERAIVQQPDDHQAYLQAGILLRDLKRFQEAESFLRKAADLAPNNWEIRNQLGAVMALNFIDHHS